MPSGRYFLADAVLTGLFVLADEDCDRVFAAFDQIAENPRGLALSVGKDWDGRFEIGYIIAPDESVITFTLLRPRAI